MNRVKVSVLAAASAAALLLGACSGDPGSPQPAPGGTGAANASNSSDPGLQAPAPTEITTEAPEGGAAVRMGDQEEAITKVGCTPINNDWTMSGSNDGGAKVALITTPDRQTVTTANVVFADGKLVDYRGDAGHAEITWDGDTFTVVGEGAYMDLGAGGEPTGEMMSFVIKATCPAS